MKLEKTYPSLLTADLAAAELWYMRLLGRAPDVWRYPASYPVSAAVQPMAIPFIWLARREHAAAESFGPAEAETPPDADPT